MKIKADGLKVKVYYDINTPLVVPIREKRKGIFVEMI